jgi:UDPglucose 6-dehydrogenase
MKITVIGAGHVGLVTGACLAELGNEVLCVDHDSKKIQILKDGRISFYEPGLDALVHTNTVEGRLSFSKNINGAISASKVIFICVGTPSLKTGEADLSSIEKISLQIAQLLDSYKLIVEKSTVPVETGQWLFNNLQKDAPKGAEFDVASNPEFLREGSAIHDFMHPDRIVIGVSSQKAASCLVQLFSPLDAPVLITDIKSAELIKHASNSFLAMKISFINAVANICEKTGADVTKVAKGMGLDTRIGEDFLKAGIGYGGSCFPKDVSAFIHIAEKNGCNFKLLEEVRNINKRQRTHFIKRVEKVLGGFGNKTIAILGLSFKPDTDDIREAPSVYIIEELLKKKVKNIRAFDSKAMDNMKKIYPDIIYCGSAYESVKGADVLFILTEWEEFRHLDLLKIKSSLLPASCGSKQAGKKPIIADGRNLYDPGKMSKIGFTYISVGRTCPPACYEAGRQPKGRRE